MRSSPVRHALSTNELADGFRSSGVRRAAGSTSCSVDCATGCTGSSSAAACSYGTLTLFTCNQFPCAVPSVTDAKTDGTRLTRTPRHDLVLGVDTQFSNRLSGGMDLRYVADVEPSVFAPADNKVGDYVLVGANLNYDITDSTQAYLRIENLLDEDYETAGGFNTPGRSAYFGIRADF